MEAGIAKLSLGENHRRVLSVLLRGLEHACNEIETWLEPKSGSLLRIEDRLHADRTREVQREIGQLREEIRRAAERLRLEPGVQSARRAISALLSTSIVQVEETDSRRLRGYGPLSAETGKQIDAELAKLLAVMERMAAIVGRR